MVFLTIYLHQFGWLSERGGNFLNSLQKEGVPRKGGGGSNPGGNYVMSCVIVILIISKVKFHKMTLSK